METRDSAPMPDGSASPSPSPSPSTPTTTSLALRYVTERHRSGEYANTTATTVRNVLLGFSRTIGNPPARTITRRHVERWLEECGLAPSSRRTAFCHVRSFCEWLTRRGYVAKLPTLDMRAPKEPRSVPRGLKHSIVDQLYTAAATRDDARLDLILSLMVQEGLRCKEVAGLQIGDMDLDDGSMLVTGKGGHQRVLPISAETRAAIDRYVASIPTALVRGPLVRSRRDPHDGITANYVSQIVAGLMDAAGIKGRAFDGISAHALRHTAATDMLRNGAHIRDVQAALGHASIATTQRYLPTLVRDLRDAMGGREYRRKVEPVADSAAS